MEIHPFFDAETSTWTYVVVDKKSQDAVIIDPVLNFDSVWNRISSISADKLHQFITANNLHVRAILETHLHADHITAAWHLKPRVHAPIGISSSIVDAQTLVAQLLNIYMATDGRPFDWLLAHEATVHAGSIGIKVRHIPGHTPTCAAYLIGDSVFVGDALFLPNLGTGRCDFPGGSAGQLFDSITEQLYSLPDSTKIYVGHDYPSEGQAPAYMTTVGESKRNNMMIPASITRSDFVSKRTARDAKLAPPRLMYQSIQVNVCAGQMPTAESNGQRYLKIPMALGLS